MSSSSTASNALGPSSSSKLLHNAAEFLIRRRILLSAILFASLIAYDVAFGPKPHDMINVHDPLGVIGALLVIGGLGLRAWSAGILHKDAELTMVGPYALIRNPLYAGSFLMMLGFCALIGNPLNIVLILVPILLIYAVKVRHEERLLASRFSEQWAIYSKSTPRFIPALRRVDLTAPWQMRQWLKHREYQALIATVAALVAIEFWHLM
jgi:protein-S-isoprenylcysteine O-methyltransferase Ste14